MELINSNIMMNDDDGDGEPMIVSTNNS